MVLGSWPAPFHEICNQVGSSPSDAGTKHWTPDASIRGVFLVTLRYALQGASSKIDNSDFHVHMEVVSIDELFGV